MANTRNTLADLGSHLEESMGRRTDDWKPRLSPVAQSKDAGRRPNRQYGSIPVDQVVPDPDQPRQHFAEDDLDRLAHSLREQGQFHPIIVRWSEELGKWVIITGERRWRATKRAGLSRIDCYFRDGEFSPSEILAQQIIENSLRADLRPVEQARAFTELMELNGWTGKQVAEALRVQPSTVSRSLALLKLPADIQDQVERGELSPRAAYELSKLDDDEARRTVAQKAVHDGLTRDQTADVVREQKGKANRPNRGTHLTFVTESGWKVVVSANRKGTYAEVEEVVLTALEEVRHRLRNNVQIL